MMLASLMVLAPVVLFSCCHCSTSEPDPQVYFQATIPRLSNLSRAQFELLASAGRPFIVTDVFEKQTMPLAGYSCDDIRKEFADARMHQEYGAAAAQDVDNTRIGDASWMDAEVPTVLHRHSDEPSTAQAPTGAADTKAPQLAPFYWGVKDGKDARMLRKVQQLTKIPYFMDKRSNMQEVMTSPEFWFSKSGAGAKAHMDAHCESTMSMQLSGTKRWRLGLPAATDRPLREGTYGDGQAYKHKGGWSPTYDIELTQGETLFFPPSFVHETTNVAATCAASVTYQYNSPMAASFFRSFWPRIRRIGDMNECWERVSSWAALGKPAAAKPSAEADAAQLFDQIDANGDSEISLAEMERVAAEPKNSLNFHDTDQDGQATKQEFLTNYALWSKVEAQVRKETGVGSWHSGTDRNREYRNSEDGSEEEDDGSEAVDKSEDGSEEEDDDEIMKMRMMMMEKDQFRGASMMEEDDHSALFHSPHDEM